MQCNVMYVYVCMYVCYVCYGMLCYVFYVVLCYVMLGYVMLMLCHVMVCYVMLCMNVISVCMFVCMNGRGVCNACNVM